MTEPKKIIWLGTHQHMPTMKFFISKCFQFDDPKVSIATYVLLRFSAVKLQKNAETADFNAFLICSKQRWIICKFDNCE